MKNLQGSELQLFQGTKGSLETIACATALSVNINVDAISNSDKDSGKFSSVVQGAISWDLSTDALVAVDEEGKNTYNELVDKMIAGEKIYITFASVKDYDEKALLLQDDGHAFTHNGTNDAVSNDDFYSGYALITSITLNANAGDTANYSVTLQGCGVLSRTKVEGE